MKLRNRFKSIIVSIFLLVSIMIPLPKAFAEASSISITAFPSLVNTSTDYNISFTYANRSGVSQAIQICRIWSLVDSSQSTPPIVVNVANATISGEIYQSSPSYGAAGIWALIFYTPVTVPNGKNMNITGTFQISSSISAGSPITFRVDCDEQNSIPQTQSYTFTLGTPWAGVYETAPAEAIAPTEVPTLAPTEIPIPTSSNVLAPTINVTPTSVSVDVSVIPSATTTPLMTTLITPTLLPSPTVTTTKVNSPIIPFSEDKEETSKLPIIMGSILLICIVATSLAFVLKPRWLSKLKSLIQRKK